MTLPKAMTLPTVVDLRSKYDRTYNQGPDPTCGPVAAANAADCAWERATGRPTRFDYQYLWRWSRWHMGFAGVTIGSTFASLEAATRLNGMKLGDDVLTGFQLVRTSVSDTSYRELKHILAMGCPVILELKLTPDIDRLSDKKNWRTHSISTDTSSSRGQHYVVIVGFDDTAQRWLAENSWGPDWADGGFFGIPYQSLQSLTESLQHFNVLPINYVPVEGYMTQAALMTAEKTAFFERSKAQLTKTLMDAYGSGNTQAMIDACVRWGVSDKHLEELAGWQRGTVRQFKQDNPAFKWDGFVWDQL